MKVSLRSYRASGDTLRPFNVGGLAPEAPKGRRVAGGVQLQNEFLVPASSSIRSVAEAGHPGIRIPSGRNHASTSTLARILKQATLLNADMPDPAFELLRP